MAALAHSRKRRREAVNVDVKLVEIYEDLANEKNEIRLKAAHDLLSRFTPEQQPSEEQIEKVLRRLFRGLCSSRKAARIGFSIALTELLSQAFSGVGRRDSEQLNISKTLEILESQTNPQNCSSGQEERDHYFGRLFGAEAILKSLVLLQPDVSFHLWTKLLNLVFDLFKKKPWLKEECGYIIYQAIISIANEKGDVRYISEIIKGLSDNGLAKTSEGVAIWLAAMDFPLPVTFTSNIWHNNNPLHSKERATIARILKESSAPQSEQDYENDAANGSGVWNPKLHFVWDPILLKLYAAFDAEKNDHLPKQLLFSEFWTEVVDNGLFSAASSEERKYWGFLAFMKVVNNAPIEAAKSIFTKNLVRCLVNQLSVEDRYLHRVAQKAAKSIQTRGANDSEFTISALRGLTGPAGIINFDQVTKTKTIEKLISDAPFDNIGQVIIFLQDLIASPGSDDIKTVGSRRQQLSTLLTLVVKSLVAKSDTSGRLDSSIKDAMVALARPAYFVSLGEATTRSYDPAVSQSSQEFFKNKISSCLNMVIAGHKNASSIVYGVIQDIHKLGQNGECGKFVIEMGQNISDSVDAGFRILKKMHHKEKKSSQTEIISIQAIKLLYSMTIFQIYNGDPDAVSMLDELKLCYDKFISQKSSKTEENAEASDVLVEILLSFASKQVQLFRRTSEQVFSAFAHQITATGLESLISILEAKDTLAGQEEMFDNDDEDSDVEMVDSDGLDSDVEEISQSSDADSDGTDDSNDESAEDNSENEAELQELDAKLAIALGTHRADEDVDTNSETSDMDDDQMEALDEKLAQVFKAQNQALSKKKQKKDARENMINFKNRALDLLEIYVKKSHSNIIATNILLPLLKVLRSSKVLQIANKASVILREYCKLCKGASLPSFEDEEPVWKLFKSIHEEATHSGPSFHSTACSQASLLVVKILVANNKDNMERIVDEYAQTRKKQLLSKKCHVQPSFFSDWNNWCVSASKTMKE
ncbi:DNA-directed DNA polymerase [Ophidiomyces ophidiicola]|nr:DNA-directed DNA polymerase [Ophidiomyces ophidiicola]KAI1969201.1 DNA-directed DNA polymerase [Ophidiomyces ophidiicola]KAI1999985.1 DNA-directed DNA polymerase [Ophidiomyces ophidiicola]KAI2012811.1 DNA-directed DNA polymerase [Ophidiomyces ophidiicola]KAI2068405.1 DNA-directed DNA polymerase [Ophidiomyces ophidiicola]